MRVQAVTEALVLLFVVTIGNYASSYLFKYMNHEIPLFLVDHHCIGGFNIACPFVFIPRRAQAVSRQYAGSGVKAVIRGSAAPPPRATVANL